MRVVNGKKVNMKRTSIWRDTAETTNFGCPEADLKTEVAIIGGGITGITCAFLLKRAGVDCVVLEALKVAGGTTGFSTGNLYCTVDEYLQSIKSKYGKDTVRSVVSSRRDAMDLVQTVATEYGIDCELTEAPFHFYAETEDYVNKVEKEAEAAEDAGLTVSIQNSLDLPFAIKKAMRVEDQLQFNPVKYVKQLSTKINEGNCKIFEGTRVVSYEKQNGGYQIKTYTGAKVWASSIIMATHTPKGVFGIQTLLFPYREYAVAYNYNGGFVPGIFWGVDGKNKHSIRHYRDGENNYLMVLGEKHKTGQKETNLENIERLKKFAAEHFSPGSEAYQWGAQHYRASDGLATVGRYDKHAAIYIATGFSTDGLTYGTMSAQIITDLITGKENPYAEIYSPHRHHPVQSAGQFIKENINVLAQYMKDFPGVKDVSKASEIKTGEGKILEQDGEKIAGYRDENNKLHLCSAVCTHMDCIVNWNEAEKTWDCPCHGSRFNYDGTVLEGPAITDLPSKKPE
jgi:glycine/D-amino acid oxidase-like deaminating enzyme/nitrite reductase/ring-hydroxylating ferredoxin subunit